MRGAPRRNACDTARHSGHCRRSRSAGPASPHGPRHPAARHNRAEAPDEDPAIAIAWPNALRPGGAAAGIDAGRAAAPARPTANAHAARAKADARPDATEAQGAASEGIRVASVRQAVPGDAAMRPPAGPDCRVGASCADASARPGH